LNREKQTDELTYPYDFPNIIIFEMEIDFQLEPNKINQQKLFMFWIMCNYIIVMKSLLPSVLCVENPDAVSNPIMEISRDLIH
jgi:hypothetical protein